MHRAQIAHSKDRRSSSSLTFLCEKSAHHLLLKARWTPRGPVDSEPLGPDACMNLEHRERRIKKKKNLPC